MSSEPSGHGNGHIYGSRNLLGQDRHIQSIISHANDLFPDRDFGLAVNGEASGSQRIFDPVGHRHLEDDELDDFGEPRNYSA